MSGFANSFWSSDYAAGLGVLFEKLQQGIQENQQVLTTARLRADADDLYANSLGGITPSVGKISGGFSKDDGASLRRAFEATCNEMDYAAKNHRKIASNIRELVINPFSRWCQAHEARVRNSQDILQAKVKLFDRQSNAVQKLRNQYYNKCRLVEDLEEENKLAFQDRQNNSIQSPKLKTIPSVKLYEPEDHDEEPIEIGDKPYSPEALKQILTSMLNNIKMSELKVAILGTYQNVSTGSDITEYTQKHLEATTINYAEQIGQDLVDHGFLRLVGNVGNSFANSSKMHYQWRPKVFRITGIPEKKKSVDRVSSDMSLDTADTPAGAVGEYLAGWNPLNNAHPNEEPAVRMNREAREADERYKSSVKKLDMLRCALEESIIDNLKFMERCELDRLKAVKSVLFDFSSAISNVIPGLQSCVDKMMLFHETIQPISDLRYLLENYRTGSFVPRVQTYENYYNSVDEQTFGIDLEARARSDRKRVPIIVTAILTFLDYHYPDLEGDQIRREIWLIDVPLAATHQLRSMINTGKPVAPEMFEKFDIPVVASVLKLYLLELPDSIISQQVYEIVKTIYSSNATDGSDEARISIIQSTLGQLRLANIATLDAITTHFTRLIELTSADESYIHSLCTSLAPCVLRPRKESPLSMDERFGYRLLRDLFAHKDVIFGKLKRASALAHSSSGGSRPRAVSSESNRRANMEKRARAIVAGASRSRNSSPAPGSRTHMPERTSAGIDMRFPVATASPTDRRGTRGSLDVPGELDSPGASTISPNGRGPGLGEVTGNGNSMPAMTSPPMTTSKNMSGSARSVEKRDSMGRMMASSTGRFPTRKSVPANSADERRGVELSDPPMED